MDYGALLQATAYLIKLLVLTAVFVPVFAIASARSDSLGYLFIGLFVILAVVMLFNQLNHLVTDRIDRELETAMDSTPSEDEEPT